MVMPIARGSRVVGLLRLERAMKPFDQFEREAANVLADSIALVVEACACCLTEMTAPATSVPATCTPAPIEPVLSPA